jgi:fibronectin-binding autotransporter adhesin
MRSSHRFGATERSWQSLSTIWQAHWITAVIAIPCALGASRVALATNGIWTNATSGGLWSVSNNWSGGTVANGIDGIADFSTLDITADDTVHLDSARTIGILNFGDVTPSNNWILDNNGNAADVLTLAVSSGAPTITVSTDEATISAALAGTQGMTKNGAGTLLLGSNDTFTGAVTVSAGTLALGNAGALGTTANAVSVASGATLDLGGQTIGTNALTIQGTGVGGNGALVNSSTTAASYAGPINNGAAGSFTVGGSGDFTFSGIVNGGMLTKVGNDTLTLSGASDNFGLGVTVNSGTVVLAKTSSSSPDVHAIGGGGLTVNGGTARLGGTGGDQIWDFTNVTVTSGALDTNGLSEKFAFFYLQGTGLGNAGALVNTAAAASAIAPTNGTVLTGNATIGVTQAAGSLTLNSAISGNFALTTVGLGTLTLSGNSTFSGGLAVQNGTLAIATINNASTSGPLGKNTSVVLGAFGQTGTLEYAGADFSPSSNMPFTLVAGSTGGFQIDAVATDLTLSGAIGGSGALAKTGPGTLTLAGLNTFTGGLLVQNGTLQVGTINNANTSGPLGNNTSVVLGSNGQTGTLEFTGTTAASSNMPFALAAGGIGGFQIDSAVNSLTLSGVVSGSGALTKSGPGTLILSGNDTFSGGVTVSDATLSLGSASALGVATNAVTVTSGATLDLRGLTIGNNVLTLLGAGVGGNGALINSSSSAAGLSGTINFTGPGPFANFTVGGTGDVNLSGTVAGSNSYTLTKVGNNRLTLSGTTDNYGLGLAVNSGTVVLAKTSSSAPNDVHAIGQPGVTVNGGTLQLGGTGGDQIYDVLTPVTVNSGAFDTNGRSETIYTLNLQGTGLGNAGALVNTAAGTSTLTLTNAVELTNNATVGGTGDITLNGSVFDSGSLSTLTKVGNNTLTLSGTTDNTNLTVAVSSGTVVLAKTSSSAPNDVHAIGGNGLTVNGGTAQLGGTGGDQIYDFSPVTVTSGAFDTNGQSETFLTLNLQGTGIGSAGALVNTAAAASAITPTNGTVLTGNATIGVTQGAGRLTLNNAISGNFALTKVGPGSLILNGNNTFTGGVTINAGTLFLGNDGALNSFSPNSVAFGPGSTGILNLNGHSVTVGGLTTDVNVGTPVVETTFPSKALTVSNSGANTFAGAVRNLTLVMAGSGTLFLSGTTDNSNLGATVSAGTLVLAKTSSGSPNDVHAIGQPGLTVNGGTAVLDGSGGDQIYDFGDVVVTSGAFATYGQSETFATLNLQGTGIGNSGALVNSLAAASTITPTNGTVLTGNATIGVIQSAGSLTLNNAVSGNFVLTKNGLGTLILTGNNTLTGGVTVSAGTLVLGNAGALGPTASVVSGATLDLGGQTVGANALSIQGTGVGGNGALVNSGASAATFAGSINASATGNSFSVGGPGDITLSGGTFGTLTKSGNNTLTLGGTTDNTGLAVTVAGGTVVLAKTSSSSPDVHAVGGNLTINGGVARLAGTGGDQLYDLANVTVINGTFDTNGQSETFGTLSLQGFGINLAGALQDTAAGASSLTPNGGTILNANTLVSVTQGGSLTLNNAVSGNFSLGLPGAGTLVLTGNNTFSGGLTVQRGTLRVPTVNNAGTSGPLGNNASVSLGYLFGGTGTLEYSGGNAMSNMPLTMVSPFQTAITGGTIQIDNPATILTLSGIISGGGALSLNGPGTLALTGTNTFSGGLSIQSGTLKVATVNNASNNGPLGPNQSVTLGSVGQTGTLECSAIPSPSTNMPFVLAAGGVGGFQIDTSFVNLTLSAPVTGAGGLAKSGPGTLTLGGPNSFTGGVTINAGKLVLSNAGALNSISPNFVAFGPASTGGLVLNGNSVVVSGLATNANVGSPFVGNFASGSSATLTINTAAANTFGGVLEDGSSGTLAVTLVGGGVETLLGNNTFTGGLVVQNGTLQVFTLNNAGTVGPLGNNPGVVLGAGGQTGSIEYSGSTASSTMRFALAAGGTGAFQVDTATTNLTLTGIISGSGGLSTTGLGTLTLSGANTYTGATTAGGGILSTNFLPNGGIVGPIGQSSNAAANLVLNGGLLQYTGTGGSTDRLYTLGTGGGGFDSSGTGPINFNNTGAIAFSGSGPRTFTFAGSNTGNNTIAQVLADGPGGATSVAKCGSGTWVLNNLNGYTGLTTITAGTLRYGGSDPTTAPPTNVQAYVLSPANPAGNQILNGSLGLDFNVNSSITIKQLGVYDSGRDGFAGAHNAYIYDRNSQAPLVTLNFPAGNTGTLSADGYRFLPLSTPLTLASGNYTIAVDFSGNDLNFNTLSGGTSAGVTNDGGSAVSFVGSSRYGSVGTFPTTLDGGPAYRYGAGSFIFDAGAVGRIPGDVTINGPTAVLDLGANQNGNVATVTLDGGGSIVGTGTSTLTSRGSYQMKSGMVTAILAGAVPLVKTTTGTVTLSGDNTYSGDDTISAGTLKFNITAGAPSIASGVTATVAGGGTLELAGTVSVLGAAGGNRVHVVNNSSGASGAAAGLVVSGMHQVVGAIDGSGTTQVNAGSDLTADHIIQSALIIGGTSGSHDLVTIDASDSGGNPLDQPSGVGLLTSSSHLAAGDMSSANLSNATIGSEVLAMGNSVGSNYLAPVPEPSTLLLALLAVLGVIGTEFVRHHFRSQTV